MLCDFEPPARDWRNAPMEKAEVREDHMYVNRDGTETVIGRRNNGRWVMADGYEIRLPGSGHVEEGIEDDESVMMVYTTNLSEDGNLVWEQEETTEAAYPTRVVMIDGVSVRLAYVSCTYHCG